MDSSELYGSNFLQLCQIAQETRFRYWSRTDVPDIETVRKTFPPKSSRAVRWENTTVEYRNELAAELLDKLTKPATMLLPAVYDGFHRTRPSFVPFSALSPVEQFEHQLLHALVLCWQPAVASEWDAMNRTAAK